VVLDGFGQDSFREGELMPQSQGGYVWHDLINRCAQALSLLAASDFDRAAAAAGKFRRTDARTAAQLSLAAVILNTRANPPRRRQDGLRALGSSGPR
ncbi:MAG: hypothetical protein ABW250_08890, partial [Pyrinomonadaceae bacterium]